MSPWLPEVVQPCDLLVAFQIEDCIASAPDERLHVPRTPFHNGEAKSRIDAYRPRIVDIHIEHRIIQTLGAEALHCVAQQTAPERACKVVCRSA